MEYCSVVYMFIKHGKALSTLSSLLLSTSSQNSNISSGHCLRDCVTYTVGLSYAKLCESKHANECKAPASSSLTQDTAGWVSGKIESAHDKKVLLRDYCDMRYITVLSVLAMARCVIIIDRFYLLWSRMQTTIRGGLLGEQAL